MTNQVLRREVKYLLGTEAYYKYSIQIGKLLRHDKHNGANGYMVRSLYFDTWDDNDFFEKEFGTDPRKKIRLRLYNPNSNVVLLEMKQKQGEQQRKRSLTITREDAAVMIRGNYTPLRAYDDPFAAECYGALMSRCYLPKVVVQYNRKAYITKENDTRITFDSNIRATISSHDIFSDKLSVAPVLDPCGIVLEVKYNGFLLNYIKNILDIVDSLALSQSKYEMSRA